MSGPAKDLIVLAADRDAEATVNGLLSRPQALGVRPVRADVRVHPNRDNGVCRACADFLRPFIRMYAHALVIFDRHGCGREASTREQIEIEVEQRLEHSGWDGRCAAIVLDPELEIWVWSASPQVDSVLGWRGRTPGLREWLTSEGFCAPGRRKPADPKRAFEQALRAARKPLSAELFGELAQKVGLRGCEDAAFVKFRAALQQWFAL